MDKLHTTNQYLLIILHCLIHNAASQSGIVFNICRMKTCFYFVVTILIACQVAEKKEPKKGLSAGESHKPKTVSKFEPSLFKTDSLQVIYYDDPDGDSLRYTRFFTYTETADTAVIKPLLKEVDQVFVQQDKIRNCRSEGKLYLLKGEEILRTLYFSTRSDTCSYLYFIKDGSFIYLPLTLVGKEILNNNRKNARKPIIPG